MSHWQNIIGHRNDVFMCTTLLILKTSVVGVHFKLVKVIPKRFQK